MKDRGQVSVFNIFFFLSFIFLILSFFLPSSSVCGKCLPFAYFADSTMCVCMHCTCTGMLHGNTRIVP